MPTKNSAPQQTQQQHKTTKTTKLSVRNLQQAISYVTQETVQAKGLRTPFK